MADESICTWAKELLDLERRAFERARRRFVRNATAERLHEVRTSARRLRSLIEDIAGVLEVDAIRERLKPLIKVTGIARDAAVIRAALRSSVVEEERATLRPVLSELRLIERRNRSTSRRRARKAALL